MLRMAKKTSQKHFERKYEDNYRLWQCVCSCGFRETIIIRSAPLNTIGECLSSVWMKHLKP